MRTRIVDNELRVHLDMMETEELEQTGYAICNDQEDIDFEVCITCINDSLMNEHYQLWVLADSGMSFTNYTLKLSYTEKQEEEEI